MLVDWKDFEIENLFWGETKKYTKESFELEMNDKVEVVELEKNKPKYIWTTKYCFLIRTFRNMQMNVPAIIGVPRNPDYYIK